MVEVGNAELVMQARNLPTTNLRASVIKAVGVCMQGSDTLHVEVRPGGFGLDAWVLDGTEWEMVDFQTNAMQPYTGKTKNQTIVFDLHKKVLQK
ncbi:hypothetical protein HOLleu_15182 [Holothuria leucospilota]|uniref:Uncharacterized protein n=1 Tax=Holothuria leucospilota TaxID=206669 RepID=A0A9Q1HCA7_HOLLE|nr:hypothetical protein HOLleu_15182 [Holothuria leucospilota]